MRGRAGKGASDGEGASLATMAAQVRSRLGERTPDVAVVLGSGLGGFTAAVSDPVEVPYSSIAGFPRATVSGHAGEFVAGEIDGVSILLQSGRFHLYEGLAPEAVALPVRLMAELGIDTLIVTNAAGALRRSMSVPSLMLIADHVNLMWRNPLIGTVKDGERRFPDMSAPYDRSLRNLARQVSLDAGIAVSEGVYIGVLGPSYETPAEIRMLQQLGGDAVGMSTVPEVIVARARGMRVVGISTISNYASGIMDHALSHDEVLEAGVVIKDDLTKLVTGLISGASQLRTGPQ